MTKKPEDIEQTTKMLQKGGYVCERNLATVLFLAMKLERPLFLEGEAGVGKTEVAKVIAEQTKKPLVRLQCYEGLDVSSAVYEWNYAAQMVEIRLREATQQSTKDSDLFSEKFLVERPLLKALRQDCVLLIDELDRADEAFEAFLLEILSDYQITIPEMGTIKAETKPVVVITTNRTREIHDALKRRCLYHWVDYPSYETEIRIVHQKVPQASEVLGEQVVKYVQKLRTQDLFKNPGVAETLDWVSALVELNKKTLDVETVGDTLGALLKYEDDLARIKGEEGQKILGEIQA